MKTIFTIAAAVGLLVVSIIVSNLMSGFKQPPAKIKPSTPKLLVDILEVKPELVSMTVTSQGTVEPKIKSTLISEVNGKITEISESFVNGGIFKKGEVLLVLESNNYQAEVMSAQARLAQTQAQYKQEKARSEQAAKDWKKIGRGKAGDLVLRVPQLEQAQADVLSAQAALKRAKRNLSKTKIIADFDGIIKSKNVDLGQFVSQGSKIAEVWGTEKSEIRLPINDAELAFLSLPSLQKDGFKPRVKITQSISGQQINWFGEINRTEGVIDQSSRVTYLVAEIEDPYRLKAEQQQPPLYFGSFVSAEIEGKQFADIYVLPKEAVNQQQKVQLFTEESKMQIVDVNILRIGQDKVFILDGLTAGDKVITTALDETLNGSKVSIASPIESAVSDEQQEAPLTDNSAVNNQQEQQTSNQQPINVSQ